MGKPTRLAGWLGFLGFTVAAVLFGYLEWRNYARLNPFTIGFTIVLCPPSLLSMLFIDLEPHTVEAVLAWSVIAMLNAGLYFVLGSLMGTRVLKSVRSAAT